MRRYQQMCGLALAMDVLGERWTVLVLRDLILGPRRFGQLRGSLHGVTPNLLSKRLNELESAGVIDRVGREGYALSPVGRQVVPALQQLAAWGGHFITGETMAEYRKCARWLMTSLCWRLQPTGEPWSLVIRVDGEHYSLWEQDGQCHVVDGALPNIKACWDTDFDRLRDLVFANRLAQSDPTTDPACASLRRALHPTTAGHNRPTC